MAICFLHKSCCRSGKSGISTTYVLELLHLSKGGKSTGLLSSNFLHGREDYAVCVSLQAVTSDSCGSQQYCGVLPERKKTIVSTSMRRYVTVGNRQNEISGLSNALADNGVKAVGACPVYARRRRPCPSVTVAVFP